MLQSTDCNWHLLKLIVQILSAWLVLERIPRLFGYSDQTRKVSSLLFIFFLLQPIFLHCTVGKLFFQLLTQLYGLQTHWKNLGRAYYAIMLSNHFSCFLTLAIRFCISQPFAQHFLLVFKIETEKPPLFRTICKAKVFILLHKEGDTEICISPVHIHFLSFPYELSGK